MISIIIPTCNRPLELDSCLSALSIQNIDSSSVEVIVCNDGNECEDFKKVKLKHPNAKWFTGPKKGPASNRNYGANQATFTWLLFIDDDCIPSPKLLEKYTQNIMAHPDTHVFEGATHAIGQRTKFNERCPENKTGGKLFSCNFLIHKDLFFDLKGFDESFPYPAAEDTDFHYRLKLNHASIKFLKDAMVQHPWQTNEKKQYKINYLGFKTWVEKNHVDNFKTTSYIYMTYVFIRNIFKETLTLIQLLFKGNKFYPSFLKYQLKTIFFLQKMLIKKI